jgi:hypothetical protein
VRRPQPALLDLLAERRVDPVQRRLIELVLDRLERGESEPPSLLRMIEAALPTR